MLSLIRAGYCSHLFSRLGTVIALWFRLQLAFGGMQNCVDCLISLHFCKCSGSCILSLNLFLFLFPPSHILFFNWLQGIGTVCFLSFHACFLSIVCDSRREHVSLRWHIRRLFLSHLMYSICTQNWQVLPSSRDPKEIVCSLMQLQNYFTFLKTVISYWHNDATIIYIYIYRHGQNCWHPW